MLRLEADSLPARRVTDRPAQPALRFADGAGVWLAVELFTKRVKWEI